MLVMSTIQIPMETRVGPSSAPGRSITAGISAPPASKIDIARRLTNDKLIFLIIGAGQIQFENPSNFLNRLRIVLRAVIGIDD